MSKRQLAALFACSVVFWTVGNGIVPLLPVFTESLGADTAMAGYSLSIAYAGLAAGALAAGWLAERMAQAQRWRGTWSLKRLLIAGAVLSIPYMYLMGQATSMLGLVAIMLVAMFLGGMGLALIGILTGISAGEKERGTVFGILAIAGSVGMLLGGLYAGPVTDAWGYPGLFAVSAALSVLTPLLALLLEDKPAGAVPLARDSSAPPAQLPGAGPQAENAGRKTGLGQGFALLFLAAVAVMVANVASQIGRSLAMDGLGFNATAISSTVAISGLVTLPLPLLAGWLSDRVGRRLILGISYAMVTLALLVLANAAELWHFWVIVALASAQGTIGGAVAPALGADLASPQTMRRAMALLSLTTWVGGILGFAATGEAVKGLGLAPAMLLAGLLPLAGVVMLGFMRRPRVPAVTPQIEGYVKREP